MLIVTPKKINSKHQNQNQNNTRTSDNSNHCDNMNPNEENANLLTQKVNILPFLLRKIFFNNALAMQ